MAHMANKTKQRMERIIGSIYSSSNKLTEIKAITNADGRIEVFGIAPDNTIWHTWQTKPNNGWNGSWGLFFLDEWFEYPYGQKNADGRIEVFGIAPDNTIWHTWQTAPNNGWWAPWTRLNFVMQHQEQTEWCWAATYCKM